MQIKKLENTGNPFRDVGIDMERYIELGRHINEVIESCRNLPFGTDVSVVDLLNKVIDPANNLEEVTMLMFMFYSHPEVKENITLSRDTSKEN